MHVKQIIIQGFKSYKDQTVIEPFSPKHNVIVGRNGSGKSNFFAAIRFVLGDSYTNMDREERQALLHEGSGSAVVTAYVEIIFDNTDGRFPTGRDEVILRRTIGQKKDEYSLDRKNATRSDVMNLLESAGFSRSNPYYIVPQGRVTALTNMKDTDRLKLLKEVAGTQVYETRRAESVKIMDDTDSKRSKIDESLSYIEERLTELEEEQKELRAYQERDREKRCLQYAIYYQQQDAATEMLHNLDSRREQGLDRSDNDREAFRAGEGELSAIDAQMSTIRRQIELLKVDKRQFESERREAMRTRARLELDIANIESQQTSQASEEEDMKKTQLSIKDRQKQLSNIEPQFAESLRKERAVKKQLDDAEGHRQRLFAKQGRNSKFQSKAERDNYLKKEIDDVNIALARSKAVSMQTDEDIAGVQKQLTQTKTQIDDLKSRLTNRNSETESLASSVREAKSARDGLMDQRKELWREQARLDSLLRNARSEVEKSERFLSNLIKGDTSRGVQAVKRIARQRGINGVYGTLSELFTVHDRFKTAVEVTAGDSLFHFVVDTDDTATKVLDILNSEKAGRVTFMPLNRLKPRDVEIPSAHDCLPMLSKLEYDSIYEKAFKQVFGKAVICPNIQIAAGYAREHGLNAITPEGDRSDKKGALTGGYHDPSASKLDAVRAATQKRNDYDSVVARETEVRQALEQLEHKITKALGDVRKVEQKRSQHENNYGPLQEELKTREGDLLSFQRVLEERLSSKDKIESSTNDLSHSLDAFEAELSSEFKKSLSTDDEKALERLRGDIPKLQKQYSDLSAVRQGLESQRSLLDVELREHLQPHLIEVQASAGRTDSSSRLVELRNDFESAVKHVAQLDEHLQRGVQQTEEHEGQLQEQTQARAEKQTEQEELAKNIERFERRMAKGMAEKVKYVQQQEEAARSIRDLGALPNEAYEKYTRVSTEKAIKRLETVNTALKKFTHVNKKAYEQYNNFTRQRESLITRRQELDTSQSSIRELIDVLDMRKDEAIQRTFKQVSREFATVFEKLVPAGKGRLIIQRKSDRLAREDATDDEGRGVENYTGVSIAVSFNSRHDEQQYISQLSGGQKSLCALALVFAIQRCDPAPFYLFDEIDANLDAQYRTAVADLLKDISQTGQFICTTFRPEMVLVAEKCYGVAYSGSKTSSIDVVSREDALSFVEGQISAT